MTRAQILDEAKEIVTNDRNKSYGEPEDSFGKIADLWSCYLKLRVEARDVAYMMALFKIARLQGNPSHMDSIKDGIGYLACAAELVGARDGLPLTKDCSPEC